MLANLASVVLLGEDTLARGDAAAELTAALLARDIVLINQSVARAVTLPAIPDSRSSPRTGPANCWRPEEEEEGGQSL